MLLVNVIMLLIGGTLTLTVQRMLRVREGRATTTGRPNAAALSASQMGDARLVRRDYLLAVRARRPPWMNLSRYCVA